MPDIRPFRAWRYDIDRAGDLSSLIAPPYDIISTSHQTALYARNPFNVIRLELTAPEANDPTGRDGEMARHERAHATLLQWQTDGVLVKDSEPALYVYRQVFQHGGKSYERRSMVAAVRLSPWQSGSILPHEHTLSAPRAERLDLLRAVNCNISPIWALYEDHGWHVAHAIDAALVDESPIEQHAIDDEGVEHHISAISSRLAVDTVRRALAEHPLFIADGHHRYETALAFRDEALIAPGPRDIGPRDYVMMVLTSADDPGLVVLPTHRLIHDVRPDRMAQLPYALQRIFHVTEYTMPDEVERAAGLIEQLLQEEGSDKAGHRFVLAGVAEGQMLVLVPREQVTESLQTKPQLAALNVWLAQELVLDQCLGISSGNLEQQTNLVYTRDIGEAITALRTGQEQLALFLAPTPVSQLLEVARAGAVMPQKSTYFFPKPATGLVLRTLEG